MIVQIVFDYLLLHRRRNIRNVKITSAFAWLLILKPNVGNTKRSFLSV